MQACFDRVPHVMRSGDVLRAGVKVTEPLRPVDLGKDPKNKCVPHSSAGKVQFVFLEGRTILIAEDVGYTLKRFPRS